MPVHHLSALWRQLTQFLHCLARRIATKGAHISGVLYCHTLARAILPPHDDLGKIVISSIEQLQFQALSVLAFFRASSLPKQPQPTFPLFLLGLRESRRITMRQIRSPSKKNFLEPGITNYSDRCSRRKIRVLTLLFSVRDEPIRLS